MSLIHWWPLNGDLKDYGINKVDLINNGATVNNNGKIGKCYKMDSYMYANNFTDLSSGDFSISYWVKYTSYPMYNEYCICINGTSSSDMLISLGICGNGTADSVGYLTVSASSTTTTLNKNQWYHICLVYKGNDGYLYLNGEYIKKYTSLGTNRNATYLTLNGRNGSRPLMSGGSCLNDMRIYNHALSTKEVKELSKGLCLHYTFEDPYTEGTTNLKPWSSTIGSSTITSWDTTKNDGSTAYYRSGWNTGYNSGVPNPSVGYHAHWVYLDGELVMKFPNLNSEVSQKGRWLGISGGFSSLPWSAGEKYTISWEQKTDNLDLVPYGGIYYKLTASSSNNFNDGFLQQRSTKLNVWERVSKTFTVSSGYDGTSTTYPAMYVYGYSSVYEGTVYIRNIQVEYKDHVTPFAAESRATSKLFDCSGYGHDAEIIYNPPYVLDSGSGKYCVDLTNNTTKGYYDLGSGALNFLTNGTVCFWAKYTDTSYKMLFGSNDAGSRYYLANTPNGNSSGGAWYTSNGGAQGTAYCDGEVYNKPKCDSQWHFYAFSGANFSVWGDYKYFLCKYANQETNSFQFHGYLADLKIYATALSASDILAEYQKKAAIDKNGNLYTWQFIENGWSGNPVLTLEDLDDHGNGIYVDKTSWADTIINTTTINAKLQPSTTYYIRYRIQRLAYPVSHSYTTQAWAYTMLYNGSSPSIGCAGLSQGIYTSLEPGDCIWVTGSFTTPSSLSNWRMLFYSARWSGSSSDWGTNAEVETVRLSEFCVSSTAFTTPNISISKKNIISCAEFQENNDNAVFCKTKEIKANEIKEN